MINNNFSLDKFNDGNYINQLINNKLLQINTIFPAQIVAVNPDGTYNIQLLMQTVAQNQATSQPIQINNVTAGKMVFGNAGIVANYVVNDIVLVGAIQRDISNMKASWKSGKPCSNRKFSYSDSVIICSLNITQPTTNITIMQNSITVNATNVTINSSNVVLGSGSGLPLLTTKSVINDSQGKPCTYQSGATQNVKGS